MINLLKISFGNIKINYRHKLTSYMDMFFPKASGSLGKYSELFQYLASLGHSRDNSQVRIYSSFPFVLTSKQRISVDALLRELAFEKFHEIVLELPSKLVD